LKALEKIQLFSAPSQLHQIGNSLLAAANGLSSKNKVDNTCLGKKLLLELDANKGDEHGRVLCRLDLERVFHHQLPQISLPG
jgi:hypothetical protein